MEKTMQTTALSRNWKLATLVLLSSAVATVCQAQYSASVSASIWFEGDAGLNAAGGPGSTVTSWVDQKAGIILTPTGTSGFTGPTVGTAQNTHATVAFSGSGFLAGASGVSGSLLASGTGNQTTIFLVESSPFDTKAQTSFGWVQPAGGGNHNYVDIRTDDATLTLDFEHGASGNLVQVSPPSPSPAYHVMMFQRDGSIPAIRFDGTPQSTTTFGSSTIDISTSGTLSLGGLVKDAVPSQPLVGNIAEVLVYNSALSDQDIRAVEQGLGTRYGISVVPEPSQYATVFGLALLGGAVFMRIRRQRAAALA